MAVSRGRVPLEAGREHVRAQLACTPEPVSAPDLRPAAEGPASPPGLPRPLWLRYSLVIVTKDRPEPLHAALHSVARALPANGELIVVDGDPGRSAATVFAEWRREHPSIAARYLTSAPGITLQRNLAIDAARGDVVVFIDDDCTVQPDLFEALARTYRDPSVVGVTGLIREPANRRLGASGRLRRLVVGGGKPGTMNVFGFRRPLVDLQQPRDMEFMYGPLMSARRNLAATVRFDESLARYALGEDDDFSYRLSRHGRLRYEPTCVVHHHELGRRGMNQRTVDRIHVVNKTYLFHKNFPVTPRARACFAAMVAVLFAHRVLNGEWSGALGLLDGVRDLRRVRRLERARAAAAAPTTMRPRRLAFLSPALCCAVMMALPTNLTASALGSDRVNDALEARAVRLAQEHNRPGAHRQATVPALRLPPGRARPQRG